MIKKNKFRSEDKDTKCTGLKKLQWKHILPHLSREALMANSRNNNNILHCSFHAIVPMPFFSSKLFFSSCRKTICAGRRQMTFPATLKKMTALRMEFNCILQLHSWDTSDPPGLYLILLKLHGNMETKIKKTPAALLWHQLRERNTWQDATMVSFVATQDWLDSSPSPHVCVCFLQVFQITESLILQSGLPKLATNRLGNVLYEKHNDWISERVLNIDTESKIWLCYTCLFLLPGDLSEHSTLSVSLSFQQTIDRWLYPKGHHDPTGH